MITIKTICDFSVTLCVCACVFPQENDLYCILFSLELILSIGNSTNMFIGFLFFKKNKKRFTRSSVYGLVATYIRVVQCLCLLNTFQLN